MWFVFFAALILNAAVSITLIRNFRKEIKGKKGIVLCGAAVISVLGGLIDLVLYHGDMSGAFTVMGAVTVLEIVLHRYLIKKNSRTLAFMGKLAVVGLLAELTIFQFPSYRLLFDDYKHIVLPAADAEFVDCEYSEELGGVPMTGTDEISMAYKNINEKVGTVHINVRFDDEETRSVNFFADLTDETGYYYRMKIIDSSLISGSKYSQDAMVQLSGATGAARFRFSGIVEEDSCVIESIELNKAIPFDIMPFRLVMFLILATFLYACVFSAVMHREYEKNKYFCRVAAVWITIGAVCCSVILVLQQIPQGKFGERFTLTEGDQITEELVTAFEQGRFDLPYEPSEELLAMENPYDTGSRYYDDVDYLWDHVFYNGKYYSYYGVAPLLLFIPYHLITGYFFPADIAVMLFAAIGLIFLAALYGEIVRKWFGRISSGAYISGLAILMAACGIWFSSGRPLFYEVSISAGFAACTSGVYFLLRSGIFGKKEKLSKFRVCISSLLIGLSVLCRPTLALYAICGCIFYIMGIKKVKRSGGKELFAYLACAAVPIMALAIFQMIYNYSRFGSPLEFGIKYSLTINDFTRTEFHVHLMLIGLYNFLFAPPAFIPDQPFVTTPFSMLGVNGYYFKDNGNVSGVLFLALPVFGYLLSGKALKKIPDIRTKIKAVLSVGLPCVVMPVIIVCSVWESGYSARYTADFSWQIIIGAYFVLYFLYTLSKNDLIKRIFTALMGASAVYAMITAGIQVYTFTFPPESCPRFTNILVRLLSFWN